MQNIILVKTDPSSKMAVVYLNNQIIMEGNYWDFHPSCHGIYEYGNFNSIDELVRLIATRLSPELVTVKRENYKYQCNNK